MSSSKWHSSVTSRTCVVRKKVGTRAVKERAFRQHVLLVLIQGVRSKGKDVESDTPVFVSDNTPYFHVVSVVRVPVTLRIIILIRISFSKERFPNSPIIKSFFPSQLRTSLFATHIHPANLPNPPSLLRMARAVCP